MSALPILSPVVAGAWRMGEWGFDVAARVRWIEEAIALGLTTFDHADIYGGYTVEALFGAALAAQPGLRERLRLVTKCGIKLISAQRPAHAIKSYDTSAAHVSASVEQSLRALRTDRIDLLLIHRPDALMDPDALAECFTRLRDAGKVLAFGVSNHTPSQFAMLHRRIPLVTNQIELSPLALDALHDGTVDQAVDLGLPPMVWSPLAGGRLFADADERTRRVRSALDAIARTHGVAPATVAFAWILRHPSRPIPITGSRRIDALREAVAAREVRLSAEEWYAVWQASMGHDVP
ncbi:MAG: aldo/keto reductase [Gemmatimonadaceae bacterium]|jgi:predicted oxidoreductase|nr:aldo/keto reductase [Gemmatimonadaceae bacterium]